MTTTLTPKAETRDLGAVLEQASESDMLAVGQAIAAMGVEWGPEHFARRLELLGAMWLNYRLETEAPLSQNHTESPGAHHDDA